MSTIEFLTKLETVIQDRLRDRQSDSYTASLAAAGNVRIAQKVGEEAVELVLAAATGSREEIVSEAADLMYHLLVLLNNRDIRLADISAALEQRHTG